MNILRKGMAHLSLFWQITRTLWIGSHYNDRITSVCKQNFATCFYSYYLTKKSKLILLIIKNDFLELGVVSHFVRTLTNVDTLSSISFTFASSSPNYWEGTLRWRKKYIFSNIQSILVKFIDEKLCESKISKYPVKNLGNRAFPQKEV